MTACTMPTLDMMALLDRMVNDPAFCGHTPSHAGQPYEVVLPQRYDPLLLNKAERKANNRKYVVSVWFVAEEEWSDNGTRSLSWRYSDLRVRELV